MQSFSNKVIRQYKLIKQINDYDSAREAGRRKNEQQPKMGTRGDRNGWQQLQVVYMYIVFYYMPATPARVAGCAKIRRPGLYTYFVTKDWL